MDRARGILVVPDWPGQPWYPILARGLKQKPVSERKSTCLASKPGSKTQTVKGTTFGYCEVSRGDSEALCFVVVVVVFSDS